MNPSSERSLRDAGDIVADPQREPALFARPKGLPDPREFFDVTSHAHMLREGTERVVFLGVRTMNHFAATPVHVNESLP